MAFFLFAESDGEDLAEHIIHTHVGECFNLEEVISLYFDCLLQKKKLFIQLTGSELDYLAEYIPLNQRNQRLVLISGNHINTIKIINMMSKSGFNCSFVVA